MNADGSNQTKLISNPNYSIEDFAVSPDGKKIAFSAIRPGVSGIPYFMLYIMNADGSNQTRLSDWNAYDPAWSPDGKKIAFSCANNIYLIDVESRNIIKLTNFIFQQCGWPTWSPDEKRLLSF
jgi:Tol biopolymer transport system component